MGESDIRLDAYHLCELFLSQPCGMNTCKIRSSERIYPIMPEQFDVKRQVDIVFSIANTLRGPYQPDKHKDVIIPMTIIRRLECALEPTKEKVCARFEANPKTPDAVLRNIAGLPFYNTSRWTLRKLLSDAPSLKRNLKHYLDAFSPNIRQILADLEFDKQIEKMAKNSRLTGTVRKFADLDLDPQRVNNVAMGYMFEEIIRRFSENAEAGDHYTPREVVRLLTKLALAEGSDDLGMPGRVINVADVACGTGGMLSVTYEELNAAYPDADIYLYGQEVNEESHAICLSDMLIKGQRADNIRLADTMKEDCFPDDKMRLVLINPPFGQPWGGKDAADGVEKAVNDERRKVNGRFPAGLPAKSDMQLLFMQHVIYKLDKNLGRACVISNGSPLFSGGTTSGESQIRRWLLANDYIEAIIGLPTDLFYNTGIGIYVWVISMNKKPERQGFVQLIDATGMWEPMRRSLGKKRRFISEEQIEEIVDIYTSFTESDVCRIFPNEEFIYREYSVYQPYQRSFMITDERIDAMVAGSFSRSMHNQARLEELRAIDEMDRTATQERDLRKLENSEPVFEQIVAILRANVSEREWLDSKEFARHVKGLLSQLRQPKAVLDKVCEFMSVMDKRAPVSYDRNGDVILDSATKDTETVRLAEDVEDYMEREVLPFVPDACWRFEESDDSIKTGAEIPFTKYFYEYEAPEASDVLLSRFFELEDELSTVLGDLR